jgi:hypothetical protein
VLGSHKSVNAVSRPSSVGMVLVKSLLQNTLDAHQQCVSLQSLRCNQDHQHKAFACQQQRVLGSHQKVSAVNSPISVGMVPVRPTVENLLPSPNIPSGDSPPNVNACRARNVRRLPILRGSLLPGSCKKPFQAREGALRTFLYRSLGWPGRPGSANASRTLRRARGS